MIKWKKMVLILSIASAFLFGFIFSGCSNDPTPEQLQKIKELEAAVTSLDQSIKTKEGEKANLERDINAIDEKLKDCEKEKQLVKDRLASWKEPAPPVVEQPVDKKVSKKKKTK
jgi:septal ring factor EnvC (AmiA/AmiB activator)